MMRTARTEANIGEELEMGTVRTKPTRSIPLKLSVRPRPGAKIPARTKYQMAEVQKLDRGIKKGTMIHSVMADMLMENTEPVMALDVTRPRRFMTWLNEKQKAARMERYTVIR
jgi:hypothetical protein